MAEDGNMQSESILSVRAVGARHVIVSLKAMFASPSGVAAKNLRAREVKNQVPGILAADVASSLAHLDSVTQLCRALADGTGQWVVDNIATKINELRSSLSSVEEAVNACAPLCVAIKAFYVEDRNAKALAKRDHLKVAGQVSALFTSVGVDPHFVKFMFDNGLCDAVSASNSAAMHSKGNIRSEEGSPTLDMLIDEVMVFKRTGRVECSMYGVIVPCIGTLALTCID
jgi:hypothetical protein